jgi:hypothetical protein
MPKNKKKIAYLEEVVDDDSSHNFVSKKQQRFNRLLNSIKENGINFDDLSDLVDVYKTKNKSLFDIIDLFKEDLNFFNYNETPFSMNLKYVDLLSIKNTTSNKIYNKLIKEYNIDDKKHYNLKFNFGELSEINKLLLGAMYSKKYQKPDSYKEILNELKDKVEEYKKSKENGEYDDGVWPIVFGNQEGEKINFQIGSTQFIFVCELLLAYLKKFEKYSEPKHLIIEETHLSLKSNGKYIFSGHQQDLAMLILKTYDENIVNSKYSSIKKFIHECLIFLSHCKKDNSKKYFSNDKDSVEYKKSVHIISKQIYKENMMSDDYFDSKFEKTKRKFIEILKEKGII